MPRLTLLTSLLVASLSAAEQAPLSLTASDGTGLKLMRLQARGVVMDPLAFTELTLTFQNPLDRVLEGQFKVTLPPGATVSRFAMKLDTRWQEGEVVERQAARRAYEDFLHRRQDPALLEQSGGNEFTARVFPIPARGVKEVIISWSHELPQLTEAYVLPLKGLPQVAELDVRVSGVTGEGVLSGKGVVPSADFVAQPKRSQSGARAGDLIVARVVPVAAGRQEPISTLTLLVDSSGSRALGWTQQTALVKQLVDKLPGVSVNVLAFDQEVASIYSGPSSGFGDEALKKLRARRALGASNIELALEAVREKPTARVVLLGDGVFTAGATEGPNLTAAVLKLKAAGVKRLDAVALGGLRDVAALGRLTTGSLERDGAVIDGDLGAAEVARRLLLETRSKLDVKVDGALDFWPRRLAGVQAGDASLIYAQLPKGTAFKATIGDTLVSVPDGQLTSVDTALLERAWTKARIAALEAKLDQADGPPQRAELSRQIVQLSTRHRVLCSLTALLVLESEADYARFSIDRRALADILVVESGQVRRLARSAEQLAVPTPAPTPREDPTTNKKPTAGKSADLDAEDGEETKEKAKKDAAPARNEEAKVAARESRPAAAAPAPQPSPMADSAPAPVVRQEPPPAAEPVAAPPPPPTAAPAGAAAARGPASAPVAAESVARPAPTRRVSPRPPGVMIETESRGLGAVAAPPKGADPWTGRFKQVMETLRANKPSAVAMASGWHEEEPGDLLALVALGEALEATGDLSTAARAYGSIIDLFPSRADLRRFAGVRLERLANARALAADTFARAAEQRPDHPASHRLLAFALLRLGKPEAAFTAIARGVSQQYPSGRFAGVDRILREDAGLVAAAWKKAEPARRNEIDAKLKELGGVPENAPSLRFVLTWETDANDVDFHITDARGGHAYYSNRVLGSGGELYADVTTGYGPECFTIRKPKGARAGPYRLQAHYYSIGPMGAGMGKLEVIEHDGAGGLTFEQRPYVVMVNQAYVDLGVVQ